MVRASRRGTKWAEQMHAGLMVSVLVLVKLFG